MAALIFTISPDPNHRSFSKTVEDGTEEDELARFTTGHVQASEEWIEVDNGEWIRRDAIVSVRIASDEPMVGFG